MKLYTLGLFLCASGKGVVQSDADRVPLVMYVNGGYSATVQEFEKEVLAMADAGVSTIILSFYMTDSPAFPLHLSDVSLQWSTYSQDDRQRIIDALHSKGTKMLLSAGGEAEGGKWQSHNSTEYGITFCLRAKYLQLDGVDFDLENVAQPGAAVTEWLHQSAKSCKQVFPEAIMTSAPQSPYLDPAQGKGPFGNGFWDDMLMVGATDGAVHNHMYTQYYNQGSWYSANTYETLFTANSAYSISTLMQTYPNVPKDTFYVGKPLKTSDGSAEDWVDYKTLHSFACKARAELEWQGGLMFWQHHWGDAEQLDTYRLLSAPCSSAATTTKPTSTPTTEMPTHSSTTSSSTPKHSDLSTAKTTISSTDTKFLSSSKSSTTTLATLTTVPGPKVSTSVETKAPSGASTTTNTPKVVTDCEAEITATQPQWVQDCRSKCALYGPGGSLAAFCPQSGTDASALIKCISTQSSYCLEKSK